MIPEVGQIGLMLPLTGGGCEDKLKLDRRDILQPFSVHQQGLKWLLPTSSDNVELNSARDDWWLKRSVMNQTSLSDCFYLFCFFFKKSIYFPSLYLPFVNSEVGLSSAVSPLLRSIFLFSKCSLHSNLCQRWLFIFQSPNSTCKVSVFKNQTAFFVPQIWPVRSKQRGRCVYCVTLEERNTADQFLMHFSRKCHLANWPRISAINLVSTCE